MNTQKKSLTPWRASGFFVGFLLWTTCLAGCGSAPEQPVLTANGLLSTPAGPEMTIVAGQTERILAQAEGAEQFEWILQGEGAISSTAGSNVLYTAPEEGGRGLLKVTASNGQGTSPETVLDIKIQTLESAALQLEGLAIPAGWMSNSGNPAAHMSLDAVNDCHTGASCERFTYRRGGVWGGIFWWPPACGASGTPAAWDNVRSGNCGINVLDTGGFSAVNRLTFWARGESGGEVIEFKIGASDVFPKPGRSSGRKSLTSDWQQYEIPLNNIDMTRAVGLFVWVARDIDNPQGAVFYLDDIQFEGVR